MAVPGAPPDQVLAGYAWHVPSVHSLLGFALHEPTLVLSLSRLVYCENLSTRPSLSLIPAAACVDFESPVPVSNCG